MAKFLLRMILMPTLSVYCINSIGWDENMLKCPNAGKLLFAAVTPKLHLPAAIHFILNTELPERSAMNYFILLILLTSHIVIGNP